MAINTIYKCVSQWGPSALQSQELILDYDTVNETIGATVVGVGQATISLTEVDDSAILCALQQPVTGAGRQIIAGPGAVALGEGTNVSTAAIAAAVVVACSPAPGATLDVTYAFTE